MRKESLQDPAMEACLLTTTGLDRYAPATRQFQGIPGIERTAAGRIFAVWYSGGKTEGPENHIVLALSDDGGLSWQDPVLIIDPAGDVRAFDPVLWIDPRGRLWLFYSQSQGHNDGRCGVWAVRCDHPDAKSLLYTPPARLCNGIMMNKPTVTSYGEWLLPAAIWKRGVVAAGCEAEQFSNVIVSTDEGVTWALRGHADVPMRDCDEHMIIERREGSLWMLVRTSYGIGESISRDGGRSWSPGMPTHIPSPVSRFYIRTLRSGRLLLITHAYSRPGHYNRPTRSHLTAYLSEDDGRTWPGSLLLDERPAVSYPDAVEGADGLIVAIHDRDRHGLGEIIMTTFREEEILAPGGVLCPDRRIIISHMQGVYKEGRR